jgi:hypothetical protein
MISATETQWKTEGAATGPRARATLSVCCMTAGPAVRVAAMLSLVREAADEIVVAVDDRAAADVREAMATVADRLLIYPYAEPVDRPIPWLHSQCAGEWVLNLDDDEVPSPGLIDALPELLRAKDVTHYWTPRRWLYPDVGHYLAEAPWLPDYQLRFVRNDPRLLRFSADLHRPLAVLGPGRFLEHPIWHLDCLIRPEEVRREKARKYERMRPGLRLGGRALNAAYFLPELRPDARLADVPTADRDSIERVLGAAAVPSGSTRAAVDESATRSEIDRLWPGRPFSESAYDARLEFLELPSTITVGERRTYDVRVANSGDDVWSWGTGGEPPVRVSSRWREVESSEVRTALPADVRPGTEAIVPVHVTAPEASGRFTLEIDLVHDHVRWFGSTLTAAVDVLPRRRIAIVGGDEAAEPVLRLLDLEPDLEPILISRDAELPWEPPGHLRAPGVRSFLFGGDPDQPGSLGLGAAFARRTAALLRGARRARAGRQTGLPPAVTSFLTALQGCRLLVVAGLDAPSGAPPPREAARVAAMARAAGVLGVPVAVLADALPRSQRRPVRGLTRLFLRRAVMYRDDGELQAELTRLAGRATP